MAIKPTDDMSDSRQDIILFQDNGVKLKNLPEQLVANGLSATPVSNIDEAKEIQKSLPSPILIREVAGSFDEIRNAIDEIIESEKISDIPILFIGEKAHDFENELRNLNSLAFTFSYPCDLQQILQAIRYISTERERLKSSSSAEDVHSIKAHPVHDKHANIHSLFFEQLDALALNKRSLGGREYIKANRSESIKDKSYLPENSTALKAFVNITEESNNWERAHLHRVAYITNRILIVLNIKDHALAAAQTAALLYACSFGKSGRRKLLRQELHNDKDGFRIEVASKIKDSAMKVALDYDLKEASQIISILGKFLAGEEVPNDLEKSICASTIMTAIILDRSVWQSGVWSPAASYQFIKDAKKGSFRMLHPAPLCCALKLLFEGITSAPPARMLRGKVLRNQALIDAAQREKEVPLNDNEKRVAIGALTPGMRLSRPITAFDGKQLLADDLILDQDLIWRIWSLSSMRPINSPVVVTESQ